MIDTLCQRYSCLPSELLAEDADELLRLLAVLKTADPEQPKPQSMESGLADLSRVGADG